MSWNIYIYAEVKENDKPWQPLVDETVFDNFKYYDNCFYETLNDIQIKDVVHPKVTALQNTSSIYPITTVRWCTLKDFTSHFYKDVEQFTTKLQSAYSALGVPLSEEDSDFYTDIQSTDEEDDPKETQQSYWFKRMSFPVNKDLLIDLITAFNYAQKAYEMMGLANTLNSMAPYSSTIRLLFVTL